MSFYLAIDAGGTKTQCLLADDSRTLAHASNGTIKLLRTSAEEATGRLTALLDEVAASAGVSLHDVTRTCIGLAGITSPAARAWATQVIPSLVGGQLILLGDEEIALEAAFHGGPGVLIIAGTGSHVVGRSTTGTLATAGGWGPILGDEGSGYWIGLEAIRAALWAHDAVDAVTDPTSTPRGRRPAPFDHSSCLFREIQHHWHLDSLADLIALGNRRTDATRPAPDFSELAPIVARCAERGDALAAGVLDRAGEELAEQVTLVASKLDVPSISIAFTGSVLASIPAVREAMTSRLATSLPEATLQSQPVDPLEGALWRARKG